MKVEVGDMFENTKYYFEIKKTVAGMVEVEILYLLGSDQPPYLSKNYVVYDNYRHTIKELEERVIKVEWRKMDVSEKAKWPLNNGFTEKVFIYDDDDNIIGNFKLWE